MEANKKALESLEVNGDRVIVDYIKIIQRLYK